MMEKGIGRICHIFHRFVKANNKCMKDYVKNKKSMYLKYWDSNNLYGWRMSKKFPVDRFKWYENTFQFNKDFIGNFNEESDEGYFFIFIFLYFLYLYDLHNDSSISPERMKIEQVEKLVCNLHDKQEYVI